MRFDKDHIKFIRIQYRNNKAFCHASLAIIGISILAFVLHYTNNYLSNPPTNGHEERQYSECSNIDSPDDGCAAFRTLSQGETNPETDHEQAETTEFVLSDFIKDKRDLNAQEGMWRATNFLGYLTIVQVFIGLAGVAVVAFTLLQTGAMLKEARKTTAAAIKATAAANRTAQSAESAETARLFVGFDCFFGRPEVSDAELPDDIKKANFIVSPTIVNHGKTPAFNVASCVFLDSGGRGNVDIDIEGRFLVDHYQRPVGDRMTPSIISNISPFRLLPYNQNMTEWYYGPAQNTEAMAGRAEHCVVYAAIFYDDVFDKTRYVFTKSIITPNDSNSKARGFWPWGERHRNLVRQSLAEDGENAPDVASENKISYIWDILDEIEVNTVLISQGVIAG